MTGNRKEEISEFYQMPPEELAGIRYSLWESALSNVGLILTTGTYLTAFALLMGAEPVHIGLMAALPGLANVLQLAGSYIVQKTGARKRLTLLCYFWSCLIWPLIIALPWMVFHWQVSGLWILIGSLAVSHILVALGGAAWLSWLTDMVPSRLRGRFLSRRNLLAGITGMIVSLAAGSFLDIWNTGFRLPHQQAMGISILFSVGILACLWAIYWVRRMPEKPRPRRENPDFLNSVRKPFGDGAFLAFVSFNALWTLSVGVASPFFGMFMIQYLVIPFSIIAAMNVTASVFNILSLRLWGRLTDELGAKPFLRVCCLIGSLLPFLWLAARPGSYGIIWLIQILAGLAWSGIGLCTFALLMNASPTEDNSVYYAVFAAVGGLAGAVAPFLGGLMGNLLLEVRVTAGPLVLENLHFVFLASGILRLGTTLLILPRVSVPDDMRLSDAVRTVATIQRQGLMTGSRRLATLGSQAMESTGTAMARGALAVQRQFGRALPAGLSLARVLGRNAGGPERLLLKGLRWMERRLDRGVRLLAGLISVPRFLRRKRGRRPSKPGL